MIKQQGNITELRESLERINLLTEELGKIENIDPTKLKRAVRECEEVIDMMLPLIGAFKINEIADRIEAEEGAKAE
ncbi:hypothetical protein [Jeotgalibacillus marinus]|uniref:Uncharacterized protein n=1 Tax=Jeotgalibacillus marinus TaxID=86667 RepID=A0ABV3Q7S6_9BACL